MQVEAFLLAKAKGLNTVLQRSQGYFAHLPRPDKSCSFIWIAWRTSFSTTLPDLGLHIDVYLFIPSEAILKLLQWQGAPGMLLEHDCRKQPQSINAGILWLVSGTASNSDLLHIWIKWTLPLHRYHMLRSIHGLYNIWSCPRSQPTMRPQKDLYKIVHQPRSKLWWSLTVKAFEASTNNLRSGVA